MQALYIAIIQAHCLRGRKEGDCSMTDQATTKLQEALGDCRKAARAIQKAIDSHETDHARIEYHRNDAEAQLGFALSAVRAAKG
jgi:hypothetical protein